MGAEVGRGGGGAGRGVGLWGEEGEHFFVDVDAEGADGEDVAADVEFAVAVCGEEEGGRDVGLGDEVAELGGYDAGVVRGGFCVVWRSSGIGDGSCGVGGRVDTRAWRCFVVVGGVGFGVGLLGVPFFEDGAELVFAAEEADSLAAVAHAGFEDPPLSLLGVFVFITGEALVEFVGFEKGFVEEFGVVEFDIDSWFDMVLQETLGILCEPG